MGLHKLAGINGASETPVRLSQLYKLRRNTLTRSLLTILGLGLILAPNKGVSQESVCTAPAIPVDFPSDDADVVFFGELHGNNESPEAFLAAVCRYLESEDGDVRVALELPTDMQKDLDRFMDSDGNSEAVQRLRASLFWQRPRMSQDGRSSVAMLDLVTGLRQLGASTRRLVSVTAFDGIAYPGHTRDAVMAAHITNLSQEADDDVVFVLTGNIHARRTPPARMSDFIPAASLVEGDILTVLVLPESGDSWSCQGTCQSWLVHQVTDFSAYENRVRTEGSYDFVLPIGLVTSSPPALGNSKSLE